MIYLSYWLDYINRYPYFCGCDYCEDQIHHTVNSWYPGGIYGKGGGTLPRQAVFTC